MHSAVQVPDEDLIERVVGRRMDPETGQIYHLTFKPPPKEFLDRLIQRSDDTEEKARARLEVHAGNVSSVVDYYKDVLVEVSDVIMLDVNAQMACHKGSAQVCGIFCNHASQSFKHNIECQIHGCLKFNHNHAITVIGVPRFLAKGWCTSTSVKW